MPIKVFFANLLFCVCEQQTNCTVPLSSVCPFFISTVTPSPSLTPHSFCLFFLSTTWTQCAPSFSHTPTFRCVGCEQTCKQTDTPAARTLSVKLSPFLTWPILTVPRFGFTDTSSAIKHNDSVGGKSRLHISHSIRLSFSQKKKKKNTCKPFMSPQICLSTLLSFPFAPVSFFLIFVRTTERSWQWGGTRVSDALMSTSKGTEGADKILSLMLRIRPRITWEREKERRKDPNLLSACASHSQTWVRQHLQVCVCA